MSETQVMDKVIVFRGNKNASLLKQIEELRIKVWGELIGARASSVRFGLDIFDYSAWHIVHMYRGRIAASGRLIIVADCSDIPDLCSFAPYLDSMIPPIGFLNRLVVDQLSRRKGISVSIINERIRLARKLEVTDLWVETQACRVASMERMGFRVVGKSLDKSVDGDWQIMRKSD